MAVPTDGVTRWFRDSNGKISQVNNVLQITITSPLVARDTYRDSPPTVVGGAASDGGSVSAVSVAGGSTQTITHGVVTDIVAPSAVVEDDNFTHVAPRILWGPLPLCFIRTKDGPGPVANPDNTTFPIDPPSGVGADFDAFDVDCVFSWGDDCAIFNVAPPGWSVGDSEPST